MARISNWAWAHGCAIHVANLRVENGPATAQVRIGWLRSVANIYHAFAVQTFADELAHAAGRIRWNTAGTGSDRLGGGHDQCQESELRRAMTISIPTIPGSCGQKSWRLRPKNQDGVSRNWPREAGMGIAAHRSFLTYVANVVEVQVGDDGQMHITRVRHRSGCGHDDESGGGARASLRARRCLVPASRLAARSRRRMAP